MEASVAIMPVVVGLLTELASKHFLAMETKSGMFCLTPTLIRTVPREKYHWLCYRENH